MTDEAFRLSETIIKALTLAGAVFAAVWAYHKYNDTKEKEFYSAFWNAKLALFLETSAAASTMGTTRSVEEFEKARSKYLELFYGRLSLVEGEVVKKAMQDFALKVPPGPIEKNSLPFTALEQPSYRLTLKLKEELGTAWHQPFGELEFAK
jgi:hypothetical protein